MKLKLLVLVTALTFVLIGCSATAPSAPAHPTPPPLGSAVTAQVPNPTPTNPASIQQQTVDALQAICSGFTGWPADPANWTITSTGTDSTPYELSLYGDGGTLVVNVTPGLPLATVTVSAANYDATNTLLAYLGCSTITTMPPAPQPVQVHKVVTIPSFVGHTQQQVTNWFMQNHLQISHSYNWGTNPLTDCTMNGWGPVTRQSIAPGTQVEDRINVTVRIDVDCETSHWVGGQNAPAPWSGVNF